MWTAAVRRDAPLVVSYYLGMSSFSNKSHHLEGSKQEETGGLIIKKKPADKVEFKKPVARASRLGLDALAREKRREQLEERKKKRSVEEPSVSKRPCLDSEDEFYSSEGRVRVSFGSSGSSRDRRYR